MSPTHIRNAGRIGGVRQGAETVGTQTKILHACKCVLKEKAVRPILWGQNPAADLLVSTMKTPWLLVGKDEL